MVVVALFDAVTEDTTLDAFLDGDDDSRDPPSVDVSPAESTAAWSQSPIACPRCESMVQRRYRTEDGALVCIECKRW